MRGLLGSDDRMEQGAVTQVPVGVGTCQCKLVFFEDSDLVVLDTCEEHAGVTTGSI